MKRTIKFLSVFISVVMIGLFSCCGDDKIPLSDEKDILSFKINGVDGQFDSYGIVINFLFPDGTDVTNLIPQITVSSKATVIPSSGAPQNFSIDKSIVYRVTAEDGSTKSYTVRVKVDTPPIPTYYVGDLYPDPDNPATAIGVVFWVDGGNTHPQAHGKIVSLDEISGIAWSTENVITGSDSMDDGKENTDKIRNNMDLNKYPAFKWCVDKGEDWYLPAYMELMDLRSRKITVNSKLQEIGAIALWSEWNHFYWESGEDSKEMAAGVHDSGFLTTAKARIGPEQFSSYIPRVRAIRAF